MNFLKIYEHGTLKPTEITSLRRGIGKWENKGGYK
jgi:hypothetical protein